MVRVRVQLIDPSGDVAPYDHALAAALARRGADVELVTSRFVHGPAAAPEGYAVDTRFYRLATRWGAERPRLRRALKLAGARARHAPLPPPRPARRHPPLPVASARRRSMPGSCRPPGRGFSRSTTSCERSGSSAGCSTGWTRSWCTRARARELLTARHGIAPERVRTIPHGAFEHLTRQPDEAPLPEELRRVEGPVVLCFGVVRPYKGVDVLLEAFRDVEAELWVVGRPLGESMERLRRLAPPGACASCRAT